MTNQSITSSLVPSLLARNIVETRAFYESIGFVVSATWPESGSVTWIEMSFENATLQFYQDPPGGTATEPVCSGTFYITTTDVDALAESFRVCSDSSTNLVMLTHSRNA